jgi:hypothetical protein
MATRFQIKYFNSFWLKKTSNGKYNLNGNENTQLPTSADGITGNAYRPTWPGNQYGGADSPTFPADVYVNTDSDDRNWIIEESRIRGGYNNTSTSYGARAYLKEDKNEQSRLDSKLIYSGIYNSTTSFNETNVFSIADDITKSLDPANGSIQKLFAEDTNMVIFQENKVSNVLVDKDAIYSAEGGGTVTSTNLVLGQAAPYLGEYGISKNPESFSYFGFRKYFVDKYRNVVLRLSRDGITEISQYGMADYFRDNLRNISDDWQNYTSTYDIDSFSIIEPYSITLNSIPDDLEIGMQVTIPQDGSFKRINTVIIGLNNETVYIPVSPVNPDLNKEVVFTKYVKDQIVGGYDTYDDFYKVSMQKALLNKEIPELFIPFDQTQEVNSVIYNGNTQTLAFDETIKGWTSFYTYRPLFMDSLRNNYYTFKTSEVWRHHDETNDNRTTFYGTQSDSNITFIFNANPSVTKNFNTIAYEGSNGWEVDFIESDFQGKDNFNGWIEKQDVTNIVKSYEEGKYTDGGVTYRSGFNRKENRYVANLVNNSQRRIGEVVFGDQMSGVKGYYITVKMSIDTTTDPGGMKELFAVSSNFVTSSY